MPREDPVLRRLRRICLALPETSETLTWGHPNWRVDGKIFAGYEVCKGKLRLGLKATLPQQSVLIADPRIEVAPYVGHRGWISFLMEGRIEWRLVSDLVLNSYHLVAPERLAGGAAVHPRSGARAASGSPAMGPTDDGIADDDRPSARGPRERSGPAARASRSRSAPRPASPRRTAR